MAVRKSIEQTIFIMFALVIFIVVTIVVLQMFLRGAGAVEAFGKRVSLQEAIRECEGYAVADKIKYCTAVYSIDINGDGKLTDVPYEGKGNLIVCESALRCYSLIDSIPGSWCLIEMCTYYIVNNRLTPEEATLKVFGKYETTLSINEKYINVLSTADAIAKQLLNLDRYKSSKNKGIVFLGVNCKQDEILLISFRQLFAEILDKAFNKSFTEVNIGVDNNGVLYMNVTNLRSDLYGVLGTLYYGSIPDKIPLCAILYVIR